MDPVDCWLCWGCCACWGLPGRMKRIAKTKSIRFICKTPGLNHDSLDCSVWGLCHLNNRTFGKALNETFDLFGGRFVSGTNDTNAFRGEESKFHPRTRKWKWRRRRRGWHGQQELAFTRRTGEPANNPRSKLHRSRHTHVECPWCLCRENRPFWSPEEEHIRRA